MLSLFDYEKGREAAAEYSFYALLSAAMRNADTYNLEKLKEAFPETHRLLAERYNNPGGLSNQEMEKLQP